VCCRLVAGADWPDKEAGKKVVEFLEEEQRPGLPSLDRDSFRALVTRFCDLSGLSIDEVHLQVDLG
jgi:hypothetical protein